jgi:hypothetical protein
MDEPIVASGWFWSAYECVLQFCYFFCAWWQVIFVGILRKEVIWCGVFVV